MRVPIAKVQISNMHAIVHHMYWYLEHSTQLHGVVQHCNENEMRWRVGMIPGQWLAR